jgi:hypothetical protein
MPSLGFGNTLFYQIPELGTRTEEFVRYMAEELALKLADFAPMGEWNGGALKDALSFVSEPVDMGDGWSIGVGNKKYLGDESMSPPRGTIAAFLTDNPQYYILPRKNRPPKYMAWAFLPEAAKAKLDAERMAGKYGGVGAQFARYAWSQNYGNASANIVAQGFLEKAIESWRSEVPQMVSRFFGS